MERRVAVVTGASSGIGEATARELARRGWLCVLLARRGDRLERLAAEIDGEWEGWHGTDRGQGGAGAAPTLGRRPRVPLLVNNAGVPGRGTFVSTEPETVERVLETNYLGGIWGTPAVLPGGGSGA